MSLKSRIKNYAKKYNITAQVVLQNYMFERFLARLSISDYKDKLIIKGGMLIASIVGLDTRSTMDLDTTLRGLPLTKEDILKAIDSIISISMNDEITFEILSISPIRKEDIYGGFCVRMNAIYESIKTPLSIDISTGDIITPDAVLYEFRNVFDDEINISLWGYNIETILAEKVETILSRNIFNTRPRDFYDIYILITTKKYDKNIFKEAFLATSKHRGSEKIIDLKTEIFAQISTSIELQNMWKKYQQKFSYARNIRYEEIIEKLKILIKDI